MWTRTDSWQQNQLKRLTLGLASTKQCNQEIRELMGAHYHSPSPTRHQLPKASYGPEPRVAFLSSKSHWAQDIWSSRNLFPYWFNLVTWNTWGRANSPHSVGQGQPGQLENYLKNDLIFSCFTECFELPAWCIWWLTTLHVPYGFLKWTVCLNSRGFQKFDILILRMFH